MEIFIIIALIILNGLFAMSEIAVVSASRSRLRDMAEKGETSAQSALDLAEDPNRFLAAVQIGISLVGVLAGAFGGATIARDLAEPLRNIEPIAPYANQVAFVSVVLFTTYLSLVIGELVPKRLALYRTEPIAMRVAGPMSLFARLAAPIIALLSFSTNNVLRLFGVPEAPQEQVEDADVIAMVRHGAALGTFVPVESEMVEGVLHLDDQAVASIMTPRPEIVWLDVNATTDDLLAVLRDTPHDYYPICRGGIDNVVGVLRMRDWLLGYLEGDPPTLADIWRTPLFVPETLDATLTLERFRTAAAPVALIIGEHGGVDGILTLTDIAHQIIGQIQTDDPDTVQREDGSWLLDGTLDIDRMARTLPGLTLPDDEHGDYLTLSGFVMKRLGHIPRTAETFSYAGWHFEIVDMDGQRIDKVLATQADDA